MSAITATVRSAGSAPKITACAQKPSACRIQASSSVGRSSPASPGITRRTGITIQFVVASTNSPTGFLNGTRSHWKWNRASSRNTKKLTTASTRKTPICANTSVLSEFFAQFRAAAARRLERALEALGELFLVEYLERRLGRAALGVHVFSQRRRRLFAGSGQLRRAEHGMERELSRNVGRQAELHARRRQLLHEPEHIRRPASRDRSDRVEQPLLRDPDDLAGRAENGLGTLLFLGADFGKGIERGDAGPDQRRG